MSTNALDHFCEASRTKNKGSRRYFPDVQGTVEDIDDRRLQGQVGFFTHQYPKASSHSDFAARFCCEAIS